MAKNQPSKAKPEELGKMLVNIYETGYLDKNQAYKQSFIKGLIGGFAGVLGATILIGLFIWILSLVAHVDVFKPFVDKVTNQVEQTKH